MPLFFKYTGKTYIKNCYLYEPEPFYKVLSHAVFSIFFAALFYRKKRTNSITIMKYRKNSKTVNSKNGNMLIINGRIHTNLDLIHMVDICLIH